jgi:hypothetical protein
MSKGCFTCGRSFNGDVNKALAAFKKQGVSRYFYRLKANGEIFVCRASSFKTIFEEQIKPNLKNGAEYSHISEYNPS